MEDKGSNIENNVKCELADTIQSKEIEKETKTNIRTNNNNNNNNNKIEKNNKNNKNSKNETKEINPIELQANNEYWYDMCKN